MRRPSSSILRTLLLLFLTGWVTGWSFLVIEVVLISPRLEGVSAASLLGTFWFQYCLTYGIGPAALLLTISSCPLPFRPVSLDRPRIALAVFFTLVVFVPFAYYVNRWHLPALFSAASLLFNVAVVLLTGLSIRLILKTLLTRQGYDRVAGTACLSWLALTATVVTLASPLYVHLTTHHEVAVPRGSAAEVEGTDQTLPNIVLILIDTMRADHLHCYGYPRETSPSLDAIAAQGTLFSSAFAQSSWTRPSVASLFTSLYPSQHNTNILTERLPEGAITLPQALGRLGYKTAAISANPNVSPLFGFGRGFDTFVSIDDRQSSGLLFLNQLSTTILGRLPLLKRIGVRPERNSSEPGPDELVNQRAQSWLSENDSGPFFLYLHYISPHAPYAPPESYEGRFFEKQPARRVSAHPQRPGDPNQPAPQLSPEDLGTMISLYDSEIAYVDQLIGRMRGFLLEHALWDDALIIVTSDHGEEFYDHQSWGHGQSLFDELIRVPLIIKAPRQTRRAVESKTPVRLVDILPSVLQYLGAIVPAGGISGEPLPLFDGDLASGSRRIEVYSEVLTRAYEIRSLQIGNLKFIETLIRGLGGHHQRSLYDLKSDPQELAPMTRLDENLLADLRHRMSLIRGKAAALEGEDVEIEKGTREHLEALGYVE